ncbi:MAG: metalloregulator ArsR/SmtB family transcription factor [Firmicutes bacterium]|nr:metalloregulator ArsR/SmtB family transcription factor [Bacillota bacterium]
MSKRIACDCEVIHSETVAKVQKELLSDDLVYGLANLYKSFGDMTRIKILHALSVSEMCVCDLAYLLNMTKSAISHQLKKLRDANLVRFRREGKVVYYSLSDSHVKTIFATGLEHLTE